MSNTTNISSPQREVPAELDNLRQELGLLADVVINLEHLLAPVTSSPDNENAAGPIAPRPSPRTTLGGCLVDLTNGTVELRGRVQHLLRNVEL